ncbi:hypothetical protein GW17_00041458 [Ensete ventricosum]|nr:hypothetical protein GW17_00041458 [Ensete ventricosum]
MVSLVPEFKVVGEATQVSAPWSVGRFDGGPDAVGWQIEGAALFPAGASRDFQRRDVVLVPQGGIPPIPHSDAQEAAAVVHNGGELGAAPRLHDDRRRGAVDEGENGPDGGRFAARLPASLRRACTWFGSDGDGQAHSGTDSRSGGRGRHGLAKRRPPRWLRWLRQREGKAKRAHGRMNSRRKCQVLDGTDGNATVERREST